MREVWAVTIIKSVRIGLLRQLRSLEFSCQPADAAKSMLVDQYRIRYNVKLTLS